MNTLESIRYEISENLTKEERADDLNEELLDELYRIDRELGSAALFTLDREYYQTPPVHSSEQVVLDETPQGTLF